MQLELKPLDEQVIVITGASSGIGLATTECAAQAGAKLVLAARSEARLAEIVGAINDEGGEAIHVVADVGRQEDVRRQIDPHRVANAILEAASEPTRDIKVGMMSKINTTTAKIGPSLGEKIAAKQANRQQYDQPPSRDPRGALWHASGGGDIYGHRPAP